MFERNRCLPWNEAADIGKKFGEPCAARCAPDRELSFMQKPAEAPPPLSRIACPERDVSIGRAENPTHQYRGALHRSGRHR